MPLQQAPSRGVSIPSKDLLERWPEECQAHFNYESNPSMGETLWCRINPEMTYNKSPNMVPKGPILAFGQAARCGWLLCQKCAEKHGKVFATCWWMRVQVLFHLTFLEATVAAMEAWVQTSGILVASVLSSGNQCLVNWLREKENSPIEIWKMCIISTLKFHFFNQEINPLRKNI